MYIGWNVQEAENVGILASLKISHFPFWFPTLKGSIREREGNGKNPFPKFGNGKGMEKIHSRNSGTGREWKNPFPKFGNGKGMKKIHSRNSGTGREWKKSIPEIREGNQRPPFLGMTGNGNSRSPLLYRTRGQAATVVNLRRRLTRSEAAKQEAESQTNRGRTKFPRDRVQEVRHLATTLTAGLSFDTLFSLILNFARSLSLVKSGSTSL